MMIDEIFKCKIKQVAMTTYTQQTDKTKNVLRVFVLSPTKAATFERDLQNTLSTKVMKSECSFSITDASFSVDEF